MNLQDRDKRALMALGFALIVALVILLWPSSSSTPKAVAPGVTTIPMAEQRLARLRNVVAAIPGKKQVLDGVAAQLKQRERGILEAETAAQAQAQLLQLIRKVARSQAPPLELGQVEMGAVQALGADYGEVLVTVHTNCRIEQLVNLLADISAQSEAIATHDLQVRASDLKQKIVAVRLTVSGVMPKRLVPERRGVGAF